MTEVIKVLQTLPDFYCLTGALEENITDAQQILGVTFAEEYMEYVSAFGAVSANGHELTGVCKPLRLNVVSVTAIEREKNPDVPHEWYVVEQANIDGIVIWQAPSGEIYQTYPNEKGFKISDSLIEYIMKR